MGYGLSRLSRFVSRRAAPEGLTGYLHMALSIPGFTEGIQ